MTSPTLSWCSPFSVHGGCLKALGAASSKVPSGACSGPRSRPVEGLAGSSHFPQSSSVRQEAGTQEEGIGEEQLGVSLSGQSKGHQEKSQGQERKAW